MLWAQIFRSVSYSAMLSRTMSAFKLHNKVLSQTSSHDSKLARLLQNGIQIGDLILTRTVGANAKHYKFVGIPEALDVLSQSSGKTDRTKRGKMDYLLAGLKGRLDIT